jgi:monofunctional biosynthetic peptidoglycan transglycosylase
MKIVRRLGLYSILAVVALYGAIAISLVYLRFLPPLTTGVQIQRRVEALATGSDYTKHYQFVPREEISESLRRAVVAAEDTRFYQHRGFDWEELRAAREAAARRGTAPRGASTISQQLVKNLYFTTHRSYLRKGLELMITPFAELILGKERILELYLNVIEWGPGIYGAEAAAMHHYGVAAAEISRERAARMAAVIPAPLSRTPDRMGSYANTIQGRMRAMGW